ncbi:hypothetical protein [Streptomyces europaeiscabiei]|uniref:hypothetical protein n=1 Tax=Streptomyces europaeiscabiei TaxID=146819 RepID=UPI002E179BF0
MTPVATSLDLRTIVGHGWVESDHFTTVEAERARRFWHAIRAQDAALARIRQQAGSLVQRRTGADWCDFGSLGLHLNLPGSDVDLGAAVARDQWPHVRAALADSIDCLGVVRTPFGSVRLAFSWRTGESMVDLSVVTPDTYEEARRMLVRIDTGITRDDRIRYTWVKHLLHVSGWKEEYAAWKLAPYRRFCPGLGPF